MKNWPPNVFHPYFIT